MPNIFNDLREKEYDYRMKRGLSAGVGALGVGLTLVSALCLGCIEQLTEAQNASLYAPLVIGSTALLGGAISLPYYNRQVNRTRAVLKHYQAQLGLTTL